MNLNLSPGWGVGLSKVIVLEDHGVRCRAYVWARDNDTAFEMKCDMLLILKELFDKEGLRISHAQKILGR